MARTDQSIMGEAATGTADSQSHKKRKLHASAMGEQTERLAAADGANRAPRTAASDGDHAPSPPPRGGAAPGPPDAARPDDMDVDPTQRVLKLLEPFSREQLLEILTIAATQHEDVLQAIKAAASADVAHRKVFVRGLAWETTTERLTAAFALFGQVEEGAVIYDKTSGKSRGYGFVTFVDMDGAQRAIEKQTVEIDGRRATCNLAAVRAQSDDHQNAHHHQQQQPPPQQQTPHYGAPGNHHAQGPYNPQQVAPPQQPYNHAPRPGASGTPYTVYTTNLQQAPPLAPVYAVPAVAPPTLAMEAPRGANANTNGNDDADRKLFVRGLSWDTTDESLRAEFLKYGELVEASVVRERKTGKSKGFGFVTFSQRASAATALQQPHKIIDGRSVTCNLASLGRAAPQPGGGTPLHQAPYTHMAPPTAYAAPPQPDMGAYAMYAQPPPPNVDPYRQQPPYGYAGSPMPPQQQYYYPPPAQGHPAHQGRRQ